MQQIAISFRVIVGSTFADLAEERNALQRRVMPELAKLCEKAGFRWLSLPGDQSSLGHLLPPGGQRKRRWPH